MAALQALKRLECQLNCPICLDTYTNPKQLQCNHVYCQKCLTGLVNRSRRRRMTLTCPNCRQVTPVPANGVAGLQAAFQINQLLEIVEEHKKAKVKDGPITAKKVEGGTKSPVTHTSGCLRHGGRPRELYCETCNEIICFKCIMKDEKHHAHGYEEISKVSARYNKEIVVSLEPMEKQLATINKALAQLDTRCEEISSQQATIEGNIHDTFTRLHQTLDVRKTELIGQLHRFTQDKLKSLAVQRDQIETTQAQLSSCLLFMRENLKTSKQGDILLKKSIAIKQVKELTTTFQPDLLEPSTEADLTFLASPLIRKDIQEYGHVTTLCSPDPSKCYVHSEEDIGKAFVGEQVFFFQAVSVDGSREALNSITCEVVSEMTGARVEGGVCRQRRNVYEICYKPTIKGRHQLHIKADGRQIKSSPFSVLVAPWGPEAFDTPILTIDGVNRPEGVAVNQRGEVVVAESHGHCISVFSPSGKKIRSFGTHGSGQGQFKYPCGVAVDGKGHIFVVDRDNRRVQKFTAEGAFVEAAGPEDNSDYCQFQSPHGIAYDASRKLLYMADVGDTNTCIHILNSDLIPIGQFGTFQKPQHVACDQSGNIYVADCDSHCIKVFKPYGDFNNEILGGPCRELTGPCGLAVDSKSQVYVSDVRSHSVSMFYSWGDHVASFGSKGSRPGQFRCPSGVAVDGGVVYVCDYINNRVQVF